MPEYNRVILKVSGEALAGPKKTGLDDDTIAEICSQIKIATEMGVQVAIVCGGGNFWRGRSGGSMDRTRADHIGMLATVMNSLALADALEQLGVNVRVQTAIEMRSIAEPYIRSRAIRHLEKGRVVIFGCGTGNPFFTTDSGAALRALEIKADALLKGTRVDGVYTADPEKDPTATKFSEITYDEIYNLGLKVMDLTATTMCKQNNLPIYVFNMDVVGNLKKVIDGENIGTYVHN